MRYLIKEIVDVKIAVNKGEFLVIPANSESKDIRLIRKISPEECSARSIEEAIRRVFHLHKHAEVIMDFIGTCDLTVTDGTYEHPFLEGVRVKEIVRR